MAESTSAATTPSGGPGAKGSSGPWWKSLTNRKKCKETLPATSGGPRPPAEPSELFFAPPNSSDSRENQPPVTGSGSRRNLKISHSGRFKEKRKSRTTLLVDSPQKLFEGGGGGGGGGGAASGSSAPARPSEETRCQ
ncbi:proline-rich protein 15 isoform 1-T7 [Liasis olivaceus]